MRYYSSVKWRPYVTEWHTYNATDPPARRIYQVSINATSGNRSEGTTSRPPSEPSSDQQSHQLVSPSWISACTPSVQGGAWLYSWRGWTHTPSAWWGGGKATQLSSTSTRQKIVSPRAYRPICLNMEPTRSFCQLAPGTSATQHARAFKAPSPRGFYRPGIVSVWSWRHKYCLFSPL